MRSFVAVACAIAVSATAALAAGPCGEPEGTCPTEQGFYRLALPPDTDSPVPALLYLNGWGRSSADVMKNEPMRATLAARGYALIAPEGIPRPGHPNRDWAVRDGAPFDRDDIPFLAEVLDDAARHGVDRERVLLAGFSRGGSMVWDVACHAPATARAYAPVAGAFWEPLPDRCDGPVDLYHVHGWSDRVAPLEGRSVAEGTLTQGDVFLSLRRLRATLGCDPHMPETAPVAADGTRWLRLWDHCPEGRLDLMLHPGGHRIPEGWLERMLDWFEARLAEE